MDHTHLSMPLTVEDMDPRQWPCIAGDQVSDKGGKIKKIINWVFSLLLKCPSRPIPNDFRPIIHYRDLDAPREPDEFL